MRKRIFKLGIFCLWCLYGMVCLSAYAKEKNKIFVDVYRSTQINARELSKTYDHELHEISALIMSSESITTKNNIDKFTKIMTKIYVDIHNSGKFEYFALSPVVYPNQTNMYFTFDLVDKKDKARLSHFTKQPTQSFYDPDNLIATWQAYEKMGFDYFLRTKKGPAIKNCPAFHCLYGFDTPMFQPYKKIFMSKVPNAKNQLIVILRSDKDEKKRAAAAFLLAHIKDGNELIQILVPSMRDPSSAVRNDVMRVLAETLTKVTNADFPIDNAIEALDYPSTVDRNKSLYILFSLSSQPRYARYIVRHAKSQLMDELKMSQRNVHGLAYSILKIISGKNYGERDYQAWDLWLKSCNKKETTA